MIQVLSNNKKGYFDSIAEASKATNVSHQAISYCIKKNKPRYVTRSDKTVFFFYKVPLRKT